MKLFRTVSAVLWAFLGVRDSEQAQEDAAKLTPLQIVAIGFGLAMLFVFGLMFVVNLVV